MQHEFKRSRRALKVQRQRFAASLRTSRLQVRVLCLQPDTYNMSSACLVIMTPGGASRCNDHCARTAGLQQAGYERLP